MHFINKKMFIFHVLFNSILKSIFIKNFEKVEKIDESTHVQL